MSVASCVVRQPPLPRLREASTAELVAELENTNGWHRDTAARLLFERQDRAAVAALERLATESNLAQARMRAAEEGLPVLRSTTTGISAVIDARGIVREHIGRNRADRIDTIVPPPHAPSWFARAAPSR